MNFAHTNTCVATSHPVNITLSIQQHCRLMKLHPSIVPQFKMNKHCLNIKVTHATLSQQTGLNCTVQLQHVFTTQQNDPSYLLSAMFLTLFGRMRVKAVRCVLWLKLRRLHWACESGFQAFCPSGVFGADIGVGYSPALFSLGHARVTWSLLQPAVVSLKRNDRSHGLWCSAFEERRGAIWWRVEAA